MKKTRVTKKCLNCGNEFEVKLSRVLVKKGKYCSKNCFYTHRSSRSRKQVICEVCGKEFTDIVSNLARGNGKCCSRACFFKSMTGTKKNPWFGRDASGEKSSTWKGGITPLHFMIRNSDAYISWRNSVFARDGYKCCDCGATQCFLEAHHKKLFTIILAEFLLVYNQFSPIEDKETLVRLAFSWAPFWDISNGKTLCRKCHDKTKRRNYETVA